MHFEVTDETTLAQSLGLSQKAAEFYYNESEKKFEETSLLVKDIVVPVMEEYDKTGKGLSSNFKECAEMLREMISEYMFPHHTINAMLPIAEDVAVNKDIAIVLATEVALNHFRRYQALVEECLKAVLTDHSDPLDDFMDGIANDM